MRKKTYRIFSIVLSLAVLTGITACSSDVTDSGLTNTNSSQSVSESAAINSDIYHLVSEEYGFAIDLAEEPEWYPNANNDGGDYEASTPRHYTTIYIKQMQYDALPLGPEEFLQGYTKALLSMSEDSDLIEFTSVEVPGSDYAVMGTFTDNNGNPVTTQAVLASDVVYFMVFGSESAEDNEAYRASFTLLSSEDKATTNEQ